MIRAISVKDRLKNQVIASGKTMQEVLTVYGLERTVYRLSISDFGHRGTDLDDIAAFEDGFAGKELHQSGWKAFLKKKKALVNVGFEEVLNLMRILLMLIAQSIGDGSEFSRSWSFEGNGWKYR